MPLTLEHCGTKLKALLVQRCSGGGSGGGEARLLLRARPPVWCRIGILERAIFEGQRRLLAPAASHPRARERRVPLLRVPLEVPLLRVAVPFEVSLPGFALS